MPGSSLTTEDILLGPEHQCRSCGQVFRSHDVRRKLCGKPMCSQGKRQAARAAHDVEFIGIDGEGVGRGKEHRYVLLGCGQRQLANEDGISWEEALGFLYECHRDAPRAAFGGFFLGYDFCQIFRTLPENRARMLWTAAGIGKRQRKGSGGNPIPFAVYLRGRDREWEIDALGLRRIKFRPKGEKGWMYVCDSGPFFQTSFLNVIDPKKWQEPIVSQAEYDLIKEGKEKRNEATLGPEMRRYMALEIETWSRVMAKLNQGFVKAGVRLSRQQWYGPGQAAQAWLKGVGSPTSNDVAAAVPKQILQAAAASYYGGWFELFQHGYIPGRMWEYDINSAYPAFIARLPCLLHGTWTHRKCPRTKYGIRELSTTRYSLVHASLSGSNGYIGCMLHRTDTGTIRRPYNTSGWYWTTELISAISADLIDEVIVDEVVEYAPCECAPPLRGVRGLYDGRLAIGKDTAAGKALKLLYNSKYGKFAQSVGKPLFANPVYASLITSGCRTMILDAIASHPNGPHDVAMVATDGIYFRSPHPHLPLSSALGEWSCEVHENMTLFKPGVYWDDKAREALRRDEAASFKARGVNAKAFSKCLLEIDEAFRDWTAAPHILPGEPDRPDWPSVEFPVEFAMVSIGQALQWNQWHLAGHVYNDKKVKQDSNPQSKRTAQYIDTEGICRSRPWNNGNPGQESQESMPYSKTFGMQHIYTELTPDGDIIDMIIEAIGMG